MLVEKRDGRVENFDVVKIFECLLEANSECSNKEDHSFLKRICREIEEDVKNDFGNDSIIKIEELEQYIKGILFNYDCDELSLKYEDYSNERLRVRQLKSDLMKGIKKIGVETDRDNANVGNNFSSKLLRIASESNKWFNLAVMPKELSKLHEVGDLYYHDLDSFNLTTNCLHIDTGKALRNGFNTGYGFLNPPKRIETAAELSCILMQSTQNDMFGGQSHPNFDNDMVYFLKLTIEETKKEMQKDGCYNDKGSSTIKQRRMLDEKVNKKLHQAMQGVVYNLNTMHARAGSQVPFSSINIGIPQGSEDDKRLAADICEAFLIEYEKGLGKGEQPIFPNIIFRVKDGVNAKPGDPYYYLFELACRVASKRMNPTFMNMDADFNKEYYDKGYMPATMGCRTYLMSNCNGEPGVEGRGNIAPTTMNLPRLGIKTSKKFDSADMNTLKIEFLKSLEELAWKAVDSLIYRHNVLKHLRVKDLPFVAGEKLMRGSEGLLPDDSIEPILRNGTYGIGFIGLAETLVALTGKHHGECEESRAFGLEIVSKIREVANKATKKYSLNFSCYATPAEGLSSKFTVKDVAKFGEIKGVTDKGYYTNSFHIPVGYVISAVDKIQIEASYHKLCNGGHITYIEVDGVPTEKDIEKVIRYSYENSNISYIGINFHIKYCKDCGTDISKTSGMICTNCGSSNIQGVSRVTGYLSLDERFGPGKTLERADRINHM